MGKLTYLFIILAPGFVFNLVVWGRWWRLLWPKRRAIATIIAASSAYWVVLDLIAVYGLQIWNFRPEHICGLFLLGLPIEEWVLFLASGGFIVPLVYVFLSQRKGTGQSSAS